MVKAIQQQQKMIDDLKAADSTTKIDAMQKTINTQQSQIDELKKQMDELKSKINAPKN